VHSSGNGCYAAMAFGADVNAQLRALQDEVSTLRNTTMNLSHGLEQERNLRQADMHTLHDRLSQERAADLSANAKSQVEFENKTKTWVEAFVKGGLAMSERVNSVPPSPKAAISGSPASFLEQRLQDLEAKAKAWAISVKQDCMALDDRIRALDAAHTGDLRTLDTEMGTLKRTLAVDIAAWGPKLEAALNNDAPLAIEASSGKFRGVVVPPSPSSVVITQAPVSAFEQSPWNDSEKAAFARQLVALEVGLMQTEKQQAADRDRATAFMATFEQELARKLDKADQHGMPGMPGTLAALQDRTENSISALQQDIQAAHRGLVELRVDQPDLLAIRRRVEALETVFPSRADAQEVSKLHLGLTEASAKAHEHAAQLRALHSTISEHDAWYRRAQDHSVSLRTLDTKAHDHASKLLSFEARAAALESEIAKKADASQHYTKDFTADLIKDLIRDFYRRDEIDAMFSKVWWRTPDVAPALTTPSSKNQRVLLPPVGTSPVGM